MLYYMLHTHTDIYIYWMPEATYKEYILRIGIGRYRGLRSFLDLILQSPEYNLKNLCRSS